MTERTLIFNGKDVQIGYIEGNEVFDLAGRKRCNYIVATGNLYDSNNKVIGHVSLDGTFVGASWRCDDLFGKPSGEAHAGRSRARMRRARDRPKQSSAARPKKLLLETAAPNAPEQRLAHSQPSRGDPEAGSNTFETIAEQMQELPPVSDGGSTVEALKPITSSASESELLGRAIGMIRSGLRHNNPLRLPTAEDVTAVGGVAVLVSPSAAIVITSPPAAIPIASLKVCANQRRSTPRLEAPWPRPVRTSAVMLRGRVGAHGRAAKGYGSSKAENVSSRSVCSFLIVAQLRQPRISNLRGGLIGNDRFSRRA